MATIVTLIDYSDVTPAVVERAEQLAKALHSRVILIHVVPKETRNAGGKSIEEDYKELTIIGNRLAKTGVNVLVEQLYDADMCRVLNECKTWDAEWIIVGSNQHSALYNWFVGSFSCDVLQKAHCPVVVVPAPTVQ